MNLPARWRALPVVVQDGALAAIVAAVEFLTLTVGDPAAPGGGRFAGADAISVALVLATNTPLALRRLAPHAVLAVTAVATVSAALLALPLQGFGPLIALYTVAAHRPRAQSLAWLALGLVVTGVVLARLGELTLFPSQVVVVGTAWLLGDRQRTRTAYAAELEQRAAELEAGREHAAALAVAEERSRVARELHDVLAHSVTVMVVGAGAARRTLERDPLRALDVVQQVAATGRESLEHLRHLLGRREDAGGTPFAPQPGVDGIAELVETFRAAGVPVRYEVRGDVAALPGSVEVSAYRIVQESLTNVLKHAGPARATVRLDYRGEALTVEVTDEGSGARPPASEEGHGLVGMRERVALLGGTLHAGPRTDGGFRVRATLPWKVPG